MKYLPEDTAAEPEEVAMEVTVVVEVAMEFPGMVYMMVELLVGVELEEDPNIRDTCMSLIIIITHCVHN